MLLSDFLCRFAAASIPVLMIAGNHDSAERLAFCNALLAEQEVYVAGACEGAVQSVLLERGGQRVAIHMLPHTRPVEMRPFLGEEIVHSEQMLRALIEKIDFSSAERHVLLCHTFVTGAQTSESEQVVVGTVDAVGAEVFAPFDYVALGHLHRPQSITKRVRYAGSPLCYSFSEIDAPKTVTLIEFGDDVACTEIPLHPLHEMREVRGALSALLDMPYSEDYVRAVVTDRDVPPDARVTLRTVFPNLMRFSVENERTRYEEEVGECEHVENRDPLELFAEFYFEQTGEAPDEARMRVMRELFSEWEGEK